jgi:hypothetical protein
LRFLNLNFIKLDILDNKAINKKKKRMFFEEMQISDKLKCPVCKKLCYDPRLLPCGKCVCQQCIEYQLSDENNNYSNDSFNCIRCNEVHKVPKNGFAVCEMIADLLKEKPREIFRCKAIEQLKQDLEEIHQNIEIIKQKMGKRNENIAEYCNFMRSEIQVKTDSVIEDIKRSKEELIYEVDKYEMDCNENFSNNIIYQQKIKSIVEDNEKFYKDLDIYLKKPIIEEDEIKEIIEMAQSKKDSIKLEITNLDAEVFNQKMPKFSQNINEIKSCLIGTLNFKPMKLFDFSNFINKFEFKAKLPDYKANAHNEIFILDNGNFIVIYQNKFDFIQFASFNKSVELIKTKSQNIRSLNLCCTYKHGNNLIYNSFEDGYYFLKIMDENLNIIKEIGIDCYSVCADSKNIICLNTKNTLDIYDWDLNKVGNVGQNQPHLPFYIGKVKQIDVCDNKYFFRSSDEIRIIDAQSGLVIHKIPSKTKQFLINEEHELVVVCSETNKITIYDLNGIQLEEYNANGVSGDSILLQDNHHHYYFYDQQNLTLVIGNY